MINFKSIVNDLLTSGNKLQLIRGNRFDAAPIVSGDGFKNISDYILNFDTFSLEDLSNYQNFKSKVNIFIELSSLESDNNKYILLKWIKHFNFCFNIILHNGDRVPEYEYLKLIIQQGATKVFSVNVLDVYDKIIPLPIGLENLHYLNNGLIDLSVGKYDNHNSKKFISRNKDLILSARFSIGTNYFERNKLATELKNKYGNEYGFVLKAEKYKKEVERVRFVLSPPGNGMDCHRTWEALVMGAIPVVKNGFLAESLIKDMPIICVEDWGDFLSLGESEMIDLYDSFVGKTTEKLYMSYWCKNIFS